MSDNTCDIVKLIEKSPVMRLSENYQSKFIEKIQKSFTETQQQLFLGSFYCYLNYNSKTDFVINFDDVWNWLGFSRKDHAKRLLIKLFIKDIDYKIETIKLHASTGGATHQTIKDNGGLNKEFITMTINTFKKLCLKANTKKADEIHEYFIKLEEVLQEILNEESSELKDQLQLKDTLLLESDHKCKIQREIGLIKAFSKKNCVYLAETYLTINGVLCKYIKLGETMDIYKRASSLRTEYGKKTYIIEVYPTERCIEFETKLFNNEVIKKNMQKIMIKNVNKQEIIKLTDRFTIVSLKNIISKTLKELNENDIQLLQITNTKLLEELKKLQIINNKLQLEINKLKNIEIDEVEEVIGDDIDEDVEAQLYQEPVENVVEKKIKKTPLPKSTNPKFKDIPKSFKDLVYKKDVEFWNFLDNTIEYTEKSFNCVKSFDLLRLYANDYNHTFSAFNNVITGYFKLQMINYIKEKFDKDKVRPEQITVRMNTDNDKNISMRGFEHLKIKDSVIIPQEFYNKTV